MEKSDCKIMYSVVVSSITNIGVSRESVHRCWCTHTRTHTAWGKLSDRGCRSSQCQSVPVKAHRPFISCICTISGLCSCLSLCGHGGRGFACESFWSFVRSTSLFYSSFDLPESQSSVHNTDRVLKPDRLLVRCTQSLLFSSADSEDVYAATLTSSY